MALLTNPSSSEVRVCNPSRPLDAPAVVLGELWAGFLLGKQRRANEAELEAFLSNPVVEEVPIDAGVARLYAEILAALRKAGTPIPTNDIWVAAQAMETGAELLSFDRHYDAVDGLAWRRLE